MCVNLQIGFREVFTNLDSALPNPACWLLLLFAQFPFGGGVSGVVAGGVSPLASPPPSQGEMWLRETCSMKEVPYLRKYHHSKICKEYDWIVRSSEVSRLFAYEISGLINPKNKHKILKITTIFFCMFFSGIHFFLMLRSFHNLGTNFFQALTISF